MSTAFGILFGVSAAFPGVIVTFPVFFAYSEKIGKSIIPADGLIVTKAVDRDAGVLIFECITASGQFSPGARKLQIK